MLEVVNSLIGLSLILVIFMYGRYLATSPSYIALATATEKLMGECKYGFELRARKGAGIIYDFMDKIEGNKITSVKYF